jgi:hypothetical protein
MKNTFKFYNSLLKNNLISKLGVFNFNELNTPASLIITSSFNTFGSEKNLKIARLYNLMFFISGQRPFIKKIKFNYMKKKILKNFILSVRLNSKNVSNTCLYFINFYIYFFHVFYQKNIKFNFFNNNFIFYIDNIQFFFKNYNKQNQKTQLKFLFKSNLNSYLKFYTYLNNLFLLKIKE